MRDINRIDTFCTELAKYWKRVPDWRFGQLLCNVLGSELKGRDMFFVEEDMMLGFFEHFFNNMPGPSEFVDNHVDL